MKAALIHKFGSIENIEIEEIPIPDPEPHEVQIAIKYAGVNPVDWKIAEGMLKTRMAYQFPIILGWDVSGEVSAVGKDVASFKEGDGVFAYCRKQTMHDGSYAQYICLNESQVAFKPKSLSFAQAAAIPLASLTAWQSLFEAANLQARESILIHAGAGGVGGYALQFAKHIGAHVITTASAENTDYVRKLGADTVINYKKENFVTAIHRSHPDGVDVVFDTVGDDTLKASYDAVKRGGRLVTIAGTIDQALATQKQLKTEFVFVRPEKSQLERIADMLETGTLSVPHIQEFPLEDVESVLLDSRTGHTRGKLVLRIP